MSIIDGKKILLTGGTGSFGKKFVEIVLKEHRPEKLIVFSRDELKQFEMSQIFSEKEHRNLRYFIGDVRDRGRLFRAFYDIDYVIHAAALKQVPACERNPFEAIQTNVMGAENIINAAIDCGVKKVVALSTDKAANPVNLYGATKLCSDKLFISGNSYAGWRETRFSVVRYGNVIGSRGSVIPYFKSMRETGVIPVTDPRMTRFWITLEQGVRFVLKCLDIAEGGELFVPKLPSMNIMDLVTAIAPDCTYEITGIRPGEKIHEVLVTEDDARHALEFDDYFIIEPEFHWWTEKKHISNGGKSLKEGFVYASNSNDKWLTIEEARAIAESC
jgi:UDP-N-acetylglucosamine 4,6-dehydratase/5-epimerase